MQNAERTTASGIEREYKIEEGAARIDDLEFAGADGLESLYIPDSVTAIGKYAFMNCYSLKEIRMPKRTERIGAGLFQNCWQLRSVRMPEGTETLGTDMFENCHALEELWLPVSLKEAARTSLSGCRSLRAIHISPGQLGILPPSARYIAAMTFMEEHANYLPAYEHSCTDAENAESKAGDKETYKSTETQYCDYEIIDAYIRERQKSFLDLAINRRSAAAVRYMVNRGLLSEEALREYLDRSAAAGRVEITALILDSLKGTSPLDILNNDPFS